MLRINSSDRTTGTPDNFTSTLSSSVQGTYHLEMALIPHTVPPVSSTRNGSIVVVVGATKHTLTIPDCYDQASVVSALKTQLDTISGLTHAVELDPVTQNIMLAVTPSASFTAQTISYKCESDDSDSTLCSVIGLYETQTFNAAPNTTVFISSHPLCLAYPLGYLVRVTVVGSPSVELDGVVDTANRLATFVLPITCNTFGVVSYTATGGMSPQHLTFHPNTTTIKVELLDDRGKTLKQASDYMLVLKKN